MAPYATPAPASRPPWRAVGAVIAVFALVAASAFAYLAVNAPDGAASPEAAVQQLFDAIDHEDAVGVLESLPPSERDVLKQPVIDIVNELQRLGILKQFELEQVPGEDLKVEGLTLATEPIGTNDDLKAVKVTGGTISGKTVPAAVPIGDTLRHIVEDDFGEHIDIPEASFSENLAQDDIRIITVKEKGGWHVSLYYSIAEAIRDNKGSPPVLGNGPKPVGSATPEGALSELVAGALDLDLERVISMMPPDEMRAVYDYAPLLLPDANKGAQEVKDSGFHAKVNRLDTRVDGEGEVRKVLVTGFDIEGGDDDATVHGTWDGTCLVVEEAYASRSSSSGSGSSTSPRTTRTEMCSNKPMVVTRGGTSTTNNIDLGKFNGLSNDYGVVVVERDGRWYVSPTRTLFDAVVTGLRKVSREDIDRWSKQFADMTGSSPAAQRCREENPYSASSSGTSYDRLEYQRTKALKACLQRAGLPDNSGFTYTDPCWAAYDELDDDADERDWDDADDEVQRCHDERYGSTRGTTPPGTASRGTVPRSGSSGSGTTVPRRSSQSGSMPGAVTSTTSTTTADEE
jgi:hypothetical protein